MKFYSLQRASLEDDLLAELCAVRDIERHPNILVFDKVIEANTEAFVLSELLTGMDLFDFLLSKHPNYLSESEAKPILRQIFSGLAHLHDECQVCSHVFI